MAVSFKSVIGARIAMAFLSGMAEAMKSAGMLSILAKALADVVGNGYPAAAAVSYTHLLLEDNKNICLKRRDKDRYYSAHASTFVCGTLDRKRSRYTVGTGNDGTFGYSYDADVCKA